MENQMEDLDRSAEDRFLDRLVMLIHDDEKLGKDKESVRAECVTAMEKAQTYEFSTEFEIATFVACRDEFGEDFDSREDLPFQNILTEQDTAPRLKASQLLTLLEEREQMLESSY